MSKKRLIDSLESLFGEPPASVLDETGFLGDNIKKPASKRKSGRTATASGERRKTSSSKSFTADLESLFQTVVSESIEKKKKKLEADPQGVAKSDSNETKEFRKPMSGLDALIRQTVEPNKEEIKRAAVPVTKKRVTFVFDKQKLVKLKKIAKVEKAYLKDIIGNLISEYLDEYQDEIDGKELPS